MKNYSKICWNCGKPTMAADGSFYRCANCDATWNRTPQPAAYELVTRPDPVRGESPSPRAKRRK